MIETRVFITFILPGSGTERLFKSIDSSRIKKVSDIENAVELAYGVSEKGDTVLFSPGSASFSQFKNTHEREKVFLKKIERKFGL